MKTPTTKFLFGLLLSGLAMANVGLWIYVATRPGLGFGEAKQTYLSYFPSLLQNPLVLTLLNIGFCGGSLLLLTRGGEPVSRSLNLVRMPVIAVNSLLVAWNVFTLM